MIITICTSYTFFLPEDKEALQKFKDDRGGNLTGYECTQTWPNTITYSYAINRHVGWRPKDSKFIFKSPKDGKKKEEMK